MSGRSANSAYSIAAATSKRSPTPPSKAPSLVPRSLVVPLVLNRSTAMPARAGSRQAALRRMWLSIMPPWVGNGCRQTSVATGWPATGSASSPTSVRPSAVCSSMSVRLAGDGQIFLSAAVNNGPLDAVATSYAGYYHLVPRLLAQLVSYLPPELAAAGLAIGAAVCTALIALFVFVASGAHLRSTLSRLLVSAVVIVMPLANENSNSPANLHWAGLYAVFWALIWRPRSLAGRVVAAAVVVLVAFSDILVLIYLPLALLRVVRRPPEGGRDRHGLVLAALD